MYRSSDFDGMIYMVGDDGIIKGMENVPALPIFSEEACGFLSELSKALLASADAKAHADVVTFAFWCRKSALKRMAESYASSCGVGVSPNKTAVAGIDRETAPAGSVRETALTGTLQETTNGRAKETTPAGFTQNRIGRGVAFHIAPSNVPVNFAYTLAAGLLAGNANIVKPPSANFPQTKIIADAIASCLNAHPEMKPYIALVKYDRKKALTDALSELADTRIIWGGNETVAEIRKSPLSPRATELTFPNRHSLLVIDAEGYLAIEDKDTIAADFFNDTFLTDQNACSSPRMVVWVCGQNSDGTGGGSGRDNGTIMSSGADTKDGESGGAMADTSDGAANAESDVKAKIIETAKCEFWLHAANIISQRYELQPAQAVKKLTESYLYSAAHKEARLSTNGGNLIYRIEVECISTDIVNHYGDSGYFFEYDIATSLNELLPLLDTSFQTLSYLGMSAEILREFVMNKRPRGVDRIVPMGHVMNFDIVWDGYDLIGAMSRVVYVR